MESKKSSIAMRVKKLRKSRNMNQSELAEKVFLSQKTISLIETGDRSINAEELQAFAEALGTSVQFLVTEIEPENLRLNKELGLSNSAIKKLTSEQDEVVARAINALVKHWDVLKQIYAFLFDECSELQYVRQDGTVDFLPVEKICGNYSDESFKNLHLLDIIASLRELQKKTRWKDNLEKRHWKGMF